MLSSRNMMHPCSSPLTPLVASLNPSYLFFYMIYATKSARIYWTKLLICFNIGALGLIIMITFMFSKGSLRVSIVGWICAVFSLCVCAAPLGII
ncbi:hypothetical protein Gohar_006578, partial [Gossypium harknessii]|nr:hypothetical protein [Gossypium harknessii]